VPIVHNDIVDSYEYYGDH